MSIGELFYQSALINALIFLWLASAISTMRIFIRSQKSVTVALMMGTLLGPLAFMIALIYEARSDKSLSSISQRRFPLWQKPLLWLIFVSCTMFLSFYFFFVAKFQHATTSNERLLENIIIFVLVAGIVFGMMLAAFTRRVAFLEGAWLTFFFSAGALGLKDWAEIAFSYGTSSAYFVTLLMSSTMLLFISLNLGGALGFIIFGEGRFNPRFSYESFIGTRFLMTKRSSQVVSLITVISVVAVMIACTGMIVVMSVMNGFTSDLRSKILGANAHLMVLKYGKDFTEYARLIDKTKDIDGVIGASPFIVNEGMVHSVRNISTAIFTGIDIDRVRESGRLKYVDEKAIDYLRDPEKIPAVSEAIDEHHATLEEAKKNEFPGVIIGKEMASELQVMVGDTVNLVSPIGDIGPTGPIPRAKVFRVAGLFNSGMYEFDAKFAFIKLNDAQDFFNLKGAVTGIEYRVDNIENTRVIAKDIEEAIGGYPFYTRDWMQMNRNMFSALQLEKVAMLIILGTLIFMASLLILVTLIMVVMEKGKEISILKSMGATDVSIMKIFVTYGLFVGGLGAVSGGGFGLFLCWLIDKIGIRLDADVYYFSAIPVKIVSVEVVMIVISAILISFLATIPPALFAARLRPVEGLRYE